VVRWIVVVTERAGGGEILTNLFLACFEHSVDAGLRNKRSDRLFQGRCRGSLPSSLLDVRPLLGVCV